MDSNNKVTDIFGIAPYGETIKLAVEKGFEGASAVLSRLCLPAADEMGLWLQDKVRYWRLLNIIKIVNKTEGKLDFTNEKLQIHPRVIHEVLEEGSWCEEDNLQNMWAGLIAASCDTTADESNILFLKSLKQLTSIQAKIINHICSTCKVRRYDNDLIAGRNVTLTFEQICEITGLRNVDQLDAELDSLRANDLIGIGGGGFQASESPLIAKLAPTAFLLNLYAKTQGFKGSLVSFYNERLIGEDEDTQHGHIIIG